MKAVINVRLRASSQSVNVLYHLDFIVMLFCLSSLVFKKYPGIHVAAKPNGMHAKIFHFGMPMVCARKNFAYILDMITPIKNRDITSNNATVRIASVGLCLARRIMLKNTIV